MSSDLFDNDSDYGVLLDTLQGFTITNNNAFSLPASELVAEAFRQQQIFDGKFAEPSTTAPVDTTLIWQDKNFNPTKYRSWDGGAWIDATFDTIWEASVGGLLAANNLSDVSDVPTSRANLELSTVSLAEAQAGVASTTRAWTSERVSQAIAAQAGSGSGDMTKAVYDPNTVEGDAFDMDNMADGTTNKVFLTTEQTKLAGIETAADVTDTTNVTAAGALMDSEVDADIKTLSLPASTTISTFGASLVDDAAASNARTTLDLDTVSQAEAEAGTATTTRAWTAQRVSQSIAALAGGGGAVDSVNGQTGVVVLDSDDITEGATNLYLTTAEQTKLGGIEALADVTDTANVTSAGALMDSEVDADLKTFSLPASTTISTFGATLVDDAAAVNARTTMDVDQAGTDNSTNVTLAGALDYLTLSGQQITRNSIVLATDVTGDTDDITEGSTNLFYTEARVSANTSVTANTAKVSASGSIDTHSDVNTVSSPPTNGQVLAFVTANGDWEPQTVGGVSADMSVATFYDATGGQVLSTVAVILNIDSTLTNNDGTLFSLASDEVTIADAGAYLISYSLVTTYTSGTRPAETAILQLDSGGGFVDVEASPAAGYNRDANDQDSTSNTITLLLAAGDKLRLTGSTHVGTVTTLSSSPYASSLSIVQLKGTKGDTGASGGVTSVNTQTGVVVLDTDDISEGATNLWFTAAEETKLAGIETAADVTDTANVTSAGALMDSEVDADLKTFSLPASTTISAFGATLVDDAAASNARTTLELNTVSQAEAETGTATTTRAWTSERVSQAIDAQAGGGDALTSNPLSQFAATTSAQLRGVLSDETGTGAAVFATSPTLVTPALGTPASGVMTNVSGTAASLTAGNVTTNANLTGHVTSVGNAAVLGSFTVAQLSTAISDATLSGNNTGDEVAASTTVSGISELATVGEINTGTDNTRTITPLGLAGSTLQSNVTTNNSKVTNATHTGDVTGSGTLTIAAKAVDIAMLADGTDGELITWSAAGVAATVAVGASTEVLTSNGPGAAPTFQVGGSGDLLSTNNLSDVANSDTSRSNLGAAPIDLGPNPQTGTAYTLALSDAGKCITMDNGSANTVTIATNAVVSFTAGNVISVIQIGAGITTIEGDTGVNVNGVVGGSVAINTRYQSVSVIKVNTNSWIVSGDSGEGESASVWVNFNGTGTIAIRDSFNVSSLTDNGAGQYSINFTSSLANTNYSVVGMCSNSDDSSFLGAMNIDRTVAIGTAMQTGLVRVGTFLGQSSEADQDVVCVAIFGG